MSTFKGFESFLIALGTAVSAMQSTFEASMNSYGWQTQRRAINPVAVSGTLGNPGNALDNDQSTYAGTGQSSGNIVVQMAANFTPTQMFVYCEPGGANTGTKFDTMSGQAPKQMTLDYSDDGASWTTLQSWTNEINWGPNQGRKYTITGAAGHKYWRLSLTNGNGGNVYIHDWFLEDATMNRISTANFFDTLPPNTETIGDASGYEVVRWIFGQTYIRLALYQMISVDQPQAIVLWNGTAGAVTYGVTIGASTVTYTGTAGNTAAQNLRGLYEAIRASSAADFTAMSWTYDRPAPQNADDTNDYIYGWTNSTSVQCLTWSTSVVNGRTIAQPWKAGTPPPSNPRQDATAYNLTIDLLNGFIYYLQVNARGFVIATKTNSAFYGPIGAHYATNAKAIAGKPVATLGFQNIRPIEAVLTFVNNSNDLGGNASPCHTYSMANSSGGATDFTRYYYKIHDWFGGFCLRDRFYDGALDWNNYVSNSVLGSAVAWSSNFFANGDSSPGNDFQVHRLSVSSPAEWETGSTTSPIAGSGNARGIYPILEIQDWYKYRGSATDESLAMVADTVAVTAIAANAAAGDGSIQVDSTTGFQSAGYIVAENEIIQYTSVDATHFLGCTRGKYGTTATAHFSGDSVSQGLWMVKINGGALFAGYQKPS